MPFDLNWAFLTGACFLSGIVGAVTFLFLMLLFDKEVTVLENDVMGRQSMASIYVLLGGVIAVIMTLGSELDLAQLRVAFAAGLGWPAVATGIGAGKQIGDLNQRRNETRQSAIEFQNLISEKRDEVARYYRTRLRRAEEVLRAVSERAEKEKEEIRSFYAAKLAGSGGDR